MQEYVDEVSDTKLLNEVGRRLKRAMNKEWYKKRYEEERAARLDLQKTMAAKDRRIAELSRDLRTARDGLSSQERHIGQLSQRISDLEASQEAPSASVSAADVAPVQRQVTIDTSMLEKIYEVLVDLATTVEEIADSGDIDA